MQWLIKLKEMKKQAGKTSRQIAEETGIPKSTVDKLFAGQTKEPFLSTVKKIVHCLGYTLDDLDESAVELEPASVSTVSDSQREQLLSNYNALNSTGRNKLVDYSVDLCGNPAYAASNTDNEKASASNIIYINKK